VGVGDARELQRRIVELKSDYGRRESMGQNGYRLYRNKFTPQRALARWSDILRPPVPGVPLEPPSSSTSA